MAMAATTTPPTTTTAATAVITTATTAVATTAVTTTGAAKGALVLLPFKQIFGGQRLSRTHRDRHVRPTSGSLCAELVRNGAKALKLLPLICALKWKGQFTMIPMFYS